MVNLSRLGIKPFHYPLFTILCLLLLFGCSHGNNVTIAPDFKLNPEQEVIYVVPFVSTLVPTDFAETVFNEFVDRLNENSAKTGIKWFFIVKEDKTDTAMVKLVVGGMYQRLVSSGLAAGTDFQVYVGHDTIQVRMNNNTRDVTVFATRPISAGLLAVALFLLVLAALPMIRKRRDEVFVE